MGLGKTIQSIAAINSMQFEMPVLIICPAVMRGTWKRELEEWAIKGKIHVCYTRKKIPSREVLRNLDYFIVSYDLATSCVDHLESVRWAALVCDESHMLKSGKAKRTRAVLGKLWPRSDYRICLSGTPITRNVIDLFSIYNKFLPDSYPHLELFGARYAYARASPYGTIYEGLRNEFAPELSATIRKHFFFRRTMEEVMTEMPAITYKRVTLGAEHLFKGDTSQKSVTELDLEIAEMIRRLEKGGAQPVLTDSMAGMRRMQGEKKIVPVCEYVRELLDQDIPVILFGFHRNFILCCMEELKAYKPVCIMGGTSPKAAEHAVKSFQAGITNLFIGNLVAAGVGITLTNSCNVVFGEIDWSPHLISQAIGRAARIGQKHPVTAHYFIVTGSIDQDIIEKVMLKARHAAQIVEN